MKWNYDLGEWQDFYGVEKNDTRLCTLTHTLTYPSSKVFYVEDPELRVGGDRTHARTHIRTRNHSPLPQWRGAPSSTFASTLQIRDDSGRSQEQS